ncbi:MAG: FliA/WhiG family RNA polymerase sigma factor [Desulfovibrio sp.]|jgi:RNA polymerase sigma factor for flagellar operon FliA|nr:FliA/WhiG family RNA polymerase sigma factor [Desulfovibrio sp.]
MKTCTEQAQREYPWDALETGMTVWEDFPPAEQEAVVRHYAPKIRFLALRLKAKLPRSVELGELISSGTLGLMEALGKFKAQLGIRFETYAESRIRGAMLDELRRLDWFPRSLRQRIRALDEAMRQIEHEHGRQATEEELHDLTGLDVRDIRQGLEALQNQLWLSLDAIQDTVSGEIQESGGEPYSVTASRELVEKVASLIDRLTPREKMVLSLYYTDELTMRETAEILGITEGRVSQLHTQALNRLRKEFVSRYGYIDESFVTNVC